MPSGNALTMRRNYVQSIIQLANAHQGGSVNLVSVFEGPSDTQLTFELDWPLRTIEPGGSFRQIRRVYVTVAMPEEEEIDGA